MEKWKAIIIDMDGTATNPGDRRKFVEQEPKDYNSFYYGIPYDKPNKWCREIVYRFADEYDPLFVSGRPEKMVIGMNEYNLRLWTVEWLVKYYPKINRPYIESHLFMRATGDHREDYIIKKEIYETQIKDKYDVLFCLDDRRQVTQMWREQGLVCLQCEFGEY